MAVKIPLLLSFYALSNGDTTLVFGQVTYTRLNDLSFKEHTPRKTFRTLLKLYRTRAYSNEEITLDFSNGQVKTETNRHGAFYFRVTDKQIQGTLQRVLIHSGEAARLIDGLYARNIHYIEGDTIVISDIDDTLVHSFINSKLRKFSTLMFTTMEKRKSVTKMHDLLKNFTAKGAIPIYLSNSEQNLYPLIYRFLVHNDFPRGPLFLKQMRKLWDVIMNIKIPPKNIHKHTTLEEMVTLFPEKKFILMGDNTQHDLPIYLATAEKFPNNIRYIIIRRVLEKKTDASLIEKATEQLDENGIGFYYADDFPEVFEL